MAAVGTLAFFGATWWTIKSDRAEKQRQADEERWDQAQAVRVSVAAVAGPPSPVGLPTNLIGVEVTNGGRRQIDQVTVSLWTGNDVRLGACPMGSIAAGYVRHDQVPWSDGAFGSTGFTEKPN